MKGVHEREKEESTSAAACGGDNSIHQAQPNAAERTVVTGRLTPRRLHGGRQGEAQLLDLMLVFGAVRPATTRACPEPKATPTAVRHSGRPDLPAAHTVHAHPRPRAG